MIHVATVHWRSDRWIDIQRRHLDRYLGGEYRVGGRVNMELHGRSELKSSLRVRVYELLQHHGPAPVHRLAKRHNPVNRLRGTLTQQVNEQSKQMMEQIARGDDFWRELA